MQNGHNATVLDGWREKEEEDGFLHVDPVTVIKHVIVSDPKNNQNTIIVEQDMPTTATVNVQQEEYELPGEGLIEELVHKVAKETAERAERIAKRDAQQGGVATVMAAVENLDGKILYNVARNAAQDGKVVIEALAGLASATLYNAADTTCQFAWRKFAASGVATWIDEVAQNIADNTSPEGPALIVQNASGAIPKDGSSTPVSNNARLTPQ